MNKQLKKIVLEDHGQDFLDFLLDFAEAIPSIEQANLQGSIWNGKKVLNLVDGDIEIGDKIKWGTFPNEPVYKLKYPVKAIIDIEAV